MKYFVLILSFVACLGIPSYANDNLVEETLGKAAAAYKSGNYKEALDYYNSIAASKSNDAGFFLQRGMVFIALENEDEAVKDFTRSIQIKPSVEALYERGIIHVKNGDTDAAKVDLEDAKYIKEDYKRLQFYLGLCYYRNGLHEYAVDCFQRNLQACGGEGECYYYLGLSQEAMNKIDDALHNLDQALPYKQNILLIHVKMYELFLKKTDYENAIVSLTKMIELSSPAKRNEYYMERSLLYSQIGDIANAQQDKKMSQHTGFNMVSSGH
jgi:tetratricopeptide (TPR) repeat protein